MNKKPKKRTSIIAFKNNNKKMFNEWLKFLTVYINLIYSIALKIVKRLN